MRHQGFTKFDKSCGNVFFMKSIKKVIEILKIWQKRSIKYFATL